MKLPLFYRSPQILTLLFPPDHLLFSCDRLCLFSTPFFHVLLAIGSHLLNRDACYYILVREIFVILSVYLLFKLKKKRKNIVPLTPPPILIPFFLPGLGQLLRAMRILHQRWVESSCLCQLGTLGSMTLEELLESFITKC